MAGALFAKLGKPVAAVIVFEDPVPPGGSTSGEGLDQIVIPVKFAGFEGASAVHQEVVSQLLYRADVAGVGDGETVRQRKGSGIFID